MPYFGLIIARPHWFTGSVGDIYLEARDVNDAYERFKEKIADANICWKNDGVYGQAGESLDLDAYARAAPTRNRDSWELKEYIEFYTANPRDCALYIEQVKEIPSVDLQQLELL